MAVMQHWSLEEKGSRGNPERAILFGPSHLGQLCVFPRLVSVSGLCLRRLTTKRSYSLDLLSLLTIGVSDNLR